VRQAVAARVADNVMVLSEATVAYVRLVVVDSAAFSRLLAGTPLPDAPQLGRLAPKPEAGARPPALLRSADGALARPTNLTVRWDDTPIELTPVGTAPAVGDGEGNVLVVDAATFAAAGADAPANTVWAIGPGAPAAATAVAGSGDVVTLRADALAARRSAPLAAGLLLLANTSVGVLLLWGLLGVLLGAAAGAPARGETLARLRTLGLRPEESRRVAAGELLPPVLVGGLGGLALGVLLAHASLGLLALRLLTGQATDPALVLPWVSVLPVLLLAVAVLVVVGVESSLRRRERLGQVLRAGNP
jgi:putative ABC transport system permease protein